MKKLSYIYLFLFFSSSLCFANFPVKIKVLNLKQDVTTWKINYGVNLDIHPTALSANLFCDPIGPGLFSYSLEQTIDDYQIHEYEEYIDTVDLCYTLAYALEDAYKDSNDKEYRRQVCLIFEDGYDYEFSYDMSDCD